MCGIAGFFGQGDAETLDAMAESLRHRGPDASGVWLSKESPVGLAHTRLAIIDLSPGGAQPMHSTDGRYAIVFNGEIYNFEALKKELPGYPFRSHSDTEVILAGYQAWGPAVFNRLHGMFALALYDSAERELILARDPAGKKPLYWTLTSDALVFGSELKALRAHPSTSHSLDLRSVGHYLARENVPTPNTIYEGISKLPPGSYARYKDKTISIEQFWKPCTSPSLLSEADALRRFDELLESATAERLVADVPLGVFLSGGIDSSTVAYYAAKTAGRQIQTFSIGFKEKSYDESAQARLVAQHLGTKHHEQILSAKDALELMDELPRVFDEPVADASVLPTLLLSRFTRGEVTVALGGDGADELLLGYPTFVAERYASAYARVPEPVRNLLQAGIDHIPASSSYMSLGFRARKFTHDFDPDPLTRHLQWLGAFKETELSGLLSPNAAEKTRGVTSELIEYWREECPELTGPNTLSHLYLRTYMLDQVLVKVDRASMRFALEVRAPFLSRDLMEFLLSLPPEMKFRSGQGKYLLRRLMRGRLPDSILDQSKKGFAAPVAQWLREDLRPLATDLLSPDHLRQSSLFSPEPITKLLEEHLAGSHNHAKKLWTLMVFQLWYDHWMK